MRSSIIFFVLVQVYLGSASLHHKITLQELPLMGSRECAEYYEISNCTLDKYIAESYPNIEPVQRLIHCTLHNLVSWTDGKGVKEHVFRNFFVPAVGDTCYANRTRECIRSAFHHLDHGNHFARAYVTFQCYYHHLIEYSKGNVLDQPNFAPGYFLGSVRGGYYSLKHGISLENLYTQFGCPELLTKELKQCVEGVVKQYCDDSHEVKQFVTFKNCLNSVIPWCSRVVAVSKEKLYGKAPCKSCVAAKEVSYVVHHVPASVGAAPKPYYNVDH
ncbi:hypothetical protein quinque_009170 [Culex quinquefasciatus]